MEHKTKNGMTMAVFFIDFWLIQRRTGGRRSTAMADPSEDGRQDRNGDEEHAGEPGPARPVPRRLLLYYHYSITNLT